MRREPIAIVGMGCRFPGGVDTPSGFWQMLESGTIASKEIGRDRWIHVAGSGLPRWGATIEDIDKFDADFFGITSAEAARMDPQQRLLAEVAWEAIENAGIAADRLAGTNTGVFAGIYNTDYAWLQHDAKAVDDVYSAIGSGTSIAANRLSYLLDLRGPSVAIDTTCSSSLVATHLAMASLERRESDTALVCGINLTISPAIARSVCSVIPMAADGRCKPFDSRADGIVRGEACVALVLKRLADVRAGLDPIVAVLLGSAVNQDGRSNGITAPNLRSQREVIQTALYRAGVNVEDVTYLEAHGTGTALGDPVEWEALQEVLGRSDRRRCFVGSVKGNIGHTEAAAGISGLAKTALALNRRTIPAQPGYTAPNPRLVQYGRPLLVPGETIPWMVQGTRIAGVSAFSVGGTNAHVVLREPAPEEVGSRPAPPFERPLALVLSARSPESLRRLADAYAGALTGDADAAGICYSAACCRSALPLRLAVTGSSLAQLRQALLERAKVLTSSASRKWVGRLLLRCGSATFDQCEELSVNEPDFGAPWSVVKSRLRNARANAGDQPLLILLAAAATLKNWGVKLSVAGPTIQDEMRSIVSSGYLVDDREKEDDFVLELSGDRPLREQLTSALATLWERGAAVDWLAYFGERRYVQLPTYPWSRKSYWFAGLREGKAETTNIPSLYSLSWEEETSSKTSCVETFNPENLGVSVSSGLLEQSWTTLQRYSRTVAPVLEEYAGESVEAALRKMGWHPPTGEVWDLRELKAFLTIAPGKEKLFERIVEILCETGAVSLVQPGVIRVERGLKTEPASLTGKSDEEQLLTRCCTALDSVLQGSRDPVELLFPEGRFDQAERLFSESAFSRVMNGCASQVVKGIVDSRADGRVIRVLEAGAGTGGTTSALLPLFPRDETEYTFTDVSGTFFPRAKVRFEAYAGMSYQTLDLERDPEMQGFENGCYDLVIAANVLHATKDVGRSLRRVHDLLAPGGLLLLAESTTKQRFTDLTYGLTSGWWKFQDVALRGKHPLLSCEKWNTALSSAGFSTVDVFPTRKTEQEGMGGVVAVARADGRRTGDPKQSWLFLSAESDVAERFRDSMRVRGFPANAIPLKEWCSGATTSIADRIVYVPGIDLFACEADSAEIVAERLEAKCRELVEIAQKVDALNQTAAVRLHVITERANKVGPAGTTGPNPLQNGLAALAATVGAEYPGIWGGLLDVDSLAADGSLAAAVLPRSRGETVLRGAAIYKPKVVPAGGIAENSSYRLEGACLVTGGFGGMGMLVAERLAQCGVKQLYLLSRSGESPESGAALARIKAYGARVAAFQCDVSDSRALSDVLAKVRRNEIPLKGVIHAAGIFADRVLAKHDWEFFRRVLAPKVSGAWNLHRLTSGIDLDYFVLFSSAARYLRPDALANYNVANSFMDALAQYRAGRNLPGASISWGGWRNVGMAQALSPRRVGVWNEAGVSGLEAKTGLDILEAIIRGGARCGHVLAMDLDPDGGRKNGATRRKDVLPSVPAYRSLRELVEAKPDEEAERLVRARVLETVAMIADLPETQFEAAAPLADYGFDSLMAIEVRNELGKMIGVDLPASFAFDFPTIEKITGKLLALIGRRNVVEQSVDAPDVSSLLTELDGVSNSDARAQLDLYIQSFFKTN